MCEADFSWVSVIPKRHQMKIMSFNSLNAALLARTSPMLRIRTVNLAERADRLLCLLWLRRVVCAQIKKRNARRDCGFVCFFSFLITQKDPVWQGEIKTCLYIKHPMGA